MELRTIGRFIVHIILILLFTIRFIRSPTPLFGAELLFVVTLVVALEAYFYIRNK